MTEKLCINCAFYADTFLFRHYREVYCTNEKLNTKEINPINGSFMKVEEKCIEVRFSEQYCGWEGKWFEPRSSLQQEITVATEEKKQEAKASRPTTRSASKVTLEDLM